MKFRDATFLVLILIWTIMIISGISLIWVVVVYCSISPVAGFITVKSRVKPPPPAPHPVVTRTAEWIEAMSELDELDTPLTDYIAFTRKRIRQEEPSPNPGRILNPGLTIYQESRKAVADSIIARYQTDPRDLVPIILRGESVRRTPISRTTTYRPDDIGYWTVKNGIAYKHVGKPEVS